jgi:hypothetical protein
MGWKKNVAQRGGEVVSRAKPRRRLKAAMGWKKKRVARRRMEGK